MTRADYGLGSAWYNYDSQTHVVSPRDITWRYTSMDGEWRVRIDNYYHPDSGASGYFTLSIAEGDGGFSELWTDASAKDGPVCVDLGSAATVDCEGDTHNLVLRTDARPIPAAGFAVVNPAVYFKRGAESSVEEVAPDGASVPLVSQRDQTTSSNPLDMVSAAPDQALVVQLTGDFFLAQWRISGDKQRTIEVRCTPVAVDAESTTPLLEQPSQQFELELPEDGYSTLDLCDAESPNSPTSVRASDFESGLWPDNRSFDLFITQSAEGLRLLPAPESAVEVRTDAWGSAEAAALPTEIWSESF
jgi:hypothetical protein